MKKETRNYITYIIIVTILFYLVGYITNASFNIKEWGETSRDMIALGFLITQIGFLITWVTDNKMNK